MVNQMVVSPTTVRVSSKRPFTAAKLVKFVGIVVLGVVVFITKQAFTSNREMELKAEARRSTYMLYNSKDQKESSLEAQPIVQKLRKPSKTASRFPKYFFEARPEKYVYKQDEKERLEFELSMSDKNFTRWQYPEYIHVPLSELGVVYLNGQKFFRQGNSTPPEYSTNGPGADTRAINDHKCGLGATRSFTNEPKSDEPRPLARSLERPREPTMQVGCCNGLPYNSSKRCCCRRASFDKETKFCCAVNGCESFRIFKRDDPNNVDRCQALNGVVVEEYGYQVGQPGNEAIRRN